MLFYETYDYQLFLKHIEHTFFVKIDILKKSVKAFQTRL